jgi:hypothetical protein
VALFLPRSVVLRSRSSPCGSRLCKATEHCASPSFQPVQCGCCIGSQSLCRFLRCRRARRQPACEVPSEILYAWSHSQHDWSGFTTIPSPSKRWSEQHRTQLQSACLVTNPDRSFVVVQEGLAPKRSHHGYTSHRLPPWSFRTSQSLHALTLK